MRLHTARAMNNRRRSPRQPVNVAVSITTPGRPDQIGVSRDLSDGGMLFHSLSRFDIGIRVQLLFRTGTHEEVVDGRVVRASRDPAWSFYPHATAVAFIDPVESPRT
jgi:hypothetical protein